VERKVSFSLVFFSGCNKRLRVEEFDSVNSVQRSSRMLARMKRTAGVLVMDPASVLVA